MHPLQNRAYLEEIFGPALMVVQVRAWPPNGRCSTVVHLFHDAPVRRCDCFVGADARGRHRLHQRVAVRQRLRGLHQLRRRRPEIPARDRRRPGESITITICRTVAAFRRTVVTVMFPTSSSLSFGVGGDQCSDPRAVAVLFLHGVPRQHPRRHPFLWQARHVLLYPGTH